ncbi:hypothetical protein HMPREF9080_00218 [Cardiobacterium valvarum F0432]|uniref:Uncharacterized protein n=1 Tax=Cardiobacterium valvarum F0432 TaxID=797473 RepID=G9ZBU1_9GAMM|nr:hypothetical protein HMPREF9080_00218 [Cardiobacterium valvarum F0432]
MRGCSAYPLLWLMPVFCCPLLLTSRSGKKNLKTAGYFFSRLWKKVSPNGGRG